MKIIHTAADATAEHLELLVAFLRQHHSHSLFDTTEATRKCHDVTGCGFIDFRYWGVDGRVVAMQMARAPRIGDHLEKEAVHAQLITGSDMARAACARISPWKTEKEDPAYILTGRGFRQRAYIAEIEKKLTTMRGAAAGSEV